MRADAEDGTSPRPPEGARSEGARVDGAPSAGGDAPPAGARLDDADRPVDRAAEPAAEPAMEPAMDPGAAPDEPTALPAAPAADSTPATSVADSTPGTGPSVAAEVAPAPPVEPAPPAVPPVLEVEDLDWAAVRAAVDPAGLRVRMRDTVERMEALLDSAGGPGLLFDEHRAGPFDRAIRVPAVDAVAPLWFVGDLHGDLLALEAALALVRREEGAAGGAGESRIVFLGDLFDDGAYGLEVVLRVLELVVERPSLVCVVAGNHDEALGFTGARFTSTVVPSDFSEYLNANLAHEWVVRAGKLAVRLFESAPRALFFPDGLLVAHGGFPLGDLHAELAATGDWNDPRCLSDFVWTRAHPKTRKKLPNRTSRGSQFGHEDFDRFCELSVALGRPVTHLVRGHDHVEERYAIYPAYKAHPVLTTVALSRRLPREVWGPFARVPTVARWVPGALPQVHRLHVPEGMISEVYGGRTAADEAPAGNDEGGA